MKIVVIGGSGLIGSRLVTKLREQGHETIAASPNSGVNTVTGEGLAEALKGAAVVVDVTNAPSWEDAEVMKFFEASTRNLLKHGRETSCDVVSCGYRPYARQRLLPRKDGSGELGQGSLASLHDRPRDAVLRVRQRHRGIFHPGKQSAFAKRAHPADGGGRCRQRPWQNRCQRAGEWLGGNWWSRTVPSR